MTLDASLLKEGYKIKEKLDTLQKRLDEKITQYKSQQEQLQGYRTQIHDKIDSFFDQVVKRVNERRDKVKNDYRLLEAKEKRRLKSK